VFGPDAKSIKPIETPMKLELYRSRFRAALQSKPVRQRNQVFARSGGNFICVVLLVLYFVGRQDANAQSWGPPVIIVYGQAYIFSGGDPGYNLGPCDNYYAPNGDSLQIDENYNVYEDGFYVTHYNWGSWTFDNPSFVASPDGRYLYGVPAGLTVVTNYQTSSVYCNGYIYPSYNYFYSGSNGTFYVAKYPNFPTDVLFQIDSSPYYIYNSPGQELVIDESGGTWPAPNLQSTPPQTVYVFDSGDSTSAAYSLQSISTSSGEGWISEQDNYYTTVTGANQQVNIQRYFNNGSFSGSISGYSDQNHYFSGSFDPIAQQVSAITPGNIEVSLSTLGKGNPQGPLYISWDDTLLLYQATDSSGNDYYSDSSGQSTVVINNGSATSGNNPAQGQISGSYNTSTSTFSISDPDFFALDSSGNPIGLPPGLTLLFGSGGRGQQMMGNDGTIYTPNYSYRRPDGSWGWKYTNAPNGNPLPSGIFLVLDEHGIYTAPPYAYTAGNEVVENAISGWPPTNLYPQQLYVNGIPCPLVPSSEYDSGAGLPRSGGASYYSPNYALTVVLSWTWDATNNFQAFVTGKYGQSSGFKGNWDGLSSFTNLTNGAIVSLTPLPTAPNDGNPPQVAVNGSALTFNSGATAALTAAGTPGDVYTGSLGQTLTINANGTVSFVPAGGGAAITGTYNATTHAFDFSNSGSGSGNVVTLGSGSNATNLAITATDSSGHPLAANGGPTTGTNGSLDIQGNSLTLGSWLLGSESLYGLALTYADAPTGSPSQLGLSTTRSALNWMWAHPSTDGGTDSIVSMQLDSLHRLLLYDPNPANQAAPTVIVDPVNGVSSVVPVRVLPAGDINMGTFTAGPQPGQ